MGRKAVRMDLRLRLRTMLRRVTAKRLAAAALVGLFAAIWPAAATAGTVSAGPASGSGNAGTPSPNTWHVPAAAFLQAAELLYDASVRGNDYETRLYVRVTEERLRSLPMQRIATAEGIEALAESVARMKRAVAAVSGDMEKRKAAASEIRLAADALAHPESPLWHRYRGVVREDVASLGTAISRTGVSPVSTANLKRLQAHYQLIRTSILLHSETYVTERADSVLRYAERILHSSDTAPDLLTRLNPAIEDAMDGLFPAKGKDKDKAAIVPPLAAGPPWGWSAFMGTFILTVLSWVGWRRYRDTERIIPRETLPPERHERH